MTKWLKVVLFILTVLLMIPLTDAVILKARGGPEAAYWLVSPYYWASWVSLDSWEARIESWVAFVDPDRTFTNKVDGISFEHPRLWGDVVRVEVPATTQEQFNANPNRCVNPETVVYVFVTNVIGESVSREVTGICPGEVATIGEGSWARGYVMEINKEDYLNLRNWIHDTKPGPLWSEETIAKSREMYEQSLAFNQKPYDYLSEVYKQRSINNLVEPERGRILMGGFRLRSVRSDLRYIESKDGKLRGVSYFIDQGIGNAPPLSYISYNIQVLDEQGDIIGIRFDPTNLSPRLEELDAEVRAFGFGSFDQSYLEPWVLKIQDYMNDEAAIDYTEDVKAAHDILNSVISQ